MPSRVCVDASQNETERPAEDAMNVLFAESAIETQVLGSPSSAYICHSESRKLVYESKDF